MRLLYLEHESAIQYALFLQWERNSVKIRDALNETAAKHMQGTLSDVKNLLQMLVETEQLQEVIARVSGDTPVIATSSHIYQSWRAAIASIPNVDNIRRDVVQVMLKVCYTPSDVTDEAMESTPSLRGDSDGHNTSDATATAPTFPDLPYDHARRQNRTVFLTDAHSSVIERALLGQWKDEVRTFREFMYDASEEDAERFNTGRLTSSMIQVMERLMHLHEVTENFHDDLLFVDAPFHEIAIWTELMHRANGSTDAMGSYLHGLFTRFFLECVSPTD